MDNSQADSRSGCAVQDVNLSMATADWAVGVEIALPQVVRIASTSAAVARVGVGEGTTARATQACCGGPIMFEWTERIVLALVAGVPVVFVVQYFLFRLGCVLADLPDPSIGRSLVAVLIAVGLILPLLVAGGLLLASIETTRSMQTGLIFYPGMALNLVLCWLLAAVVYWLVLSTSYTKGLVVAGVELLLSALFAALVTAVLMVLGAGWQIAERPPSHSEWVPHGPPARERDVYS